MQDKNRLEAKQQIKGFLGAIPVCGLLTICLEVGLAVLHRGGSVKNHLIHFVILLLAAEGMVLLYGAVPSVRRAWARIDRRILSAETRKKWVDYTYAALAMILMLHHFYVLLYYPTLPAGASRFAPAWIPFAVITVLMGKLWRDKGFWISVLLAAFLFERTYLKNPDITGETMVYMVSAIYALILCYGVFGVIQPEHRRGMLRILSAIWTLATLAFCFAGLYFVWTGEIVQNLGAGKTELFDLWDGTVKKIRLGIFSNPNITGGIIAGGAGFALIGFASAKNVLCKILYVIACFLMLLTNALAATRSCFIMLSFAIAGMITLGIWGLLKKHISIRKWGNIPLALGMVVCLAGSIWITYNLQQNLGKQFIEIRDRGGVIIPSANAENSDAAPAPLPSFVERDTINISDVKSLDKVFGDRWPIWETAFEYAKSHTDVLLYGISADGSVKTAIQRNDHCHNILIQTFMEGGIIGIGLFLGLLGYFFFLACRLWRRWDLPLWQRMLPVPALAVLMMEMVECLTHFAYGHVPMTVLYFFIGATVAVSRNLKSDKETVVENK